MQLSPSGMGCGTKTITNELHNCAYSTLHFMENKAHFVPLIRPRKVQYIGHEQN